MTHHNQTKELITWFLTIQKPRAHPGTQHLATHVCLHLPTMPPPPLPACPRHRHHRPPTTVTAAAHHHRHHPHLTSPATAHPPHLLTADAWLLHRLLGGPPPRAARRKTIDATWRTATRCRWRFAATSQHGPLPLPCLGHCFLEWVPPA
jgi:hypothetical protein